MPPSLNPTSLARTRDNARASASSLQLEISVANRQRDALWERIGSKLEEARHLLNERVKPQFANYARCGQESLYRICVNCGNWKELSYQCSIKWCPRCVWKISDNRQQELKHWTSRVQQPKHIVTTQLNIGIITRQDFTRNTKNMRQLQRSKVFEKVNGGCVSTEVTNKSRGWHLHNHWLVDARWVDAKELAKRWGEIVGQQFAIVKVKDARAQDYRAEVAKYVVKSSEMAAWTPQQIAGFVNSLYRTRLFVKFGTLRTEPPPPKPAYETPVCACGCGQYVTQDERGVALSEIRNR